MKKITITEEEYRNMMFFMNYAETELLLKWSNENEDKKSEKAYESLYYQCKELKENLEKKCLK